jgi:uncharacterized membrane protein
MKLLGAGAASAGISEPIWGTLIGPLFLNALAGLLNGAPSARARRWACGW